MILNTGGRTDTVQYYSEWLLNRFREGYVLSRNPLFPNTINRIELSPDKIDVVVFCSKDYSPILENLHQIYNRFRCYYHYTITAYDTDIEPNVPPIEQSVKTLKKLSQMVGKQKVAWRYDPVLLTEKYSVFRHIETFDYLAKELTPYVDRCIFSFVGMYKKLAYNMPELQPVADNDKIFLAKNFGEIAKKYGLYLQTCGERNDYSKFNIHKSGCLTAEILGKALNIKFKKTPYKPSRHGCGCLDCRGLGDYNSCPNGCRYCYANNDHVKAQENYLSHDPLSPLLLGHILDTDIIKPAVQTSFLDNEPSLFG